MLKLPGPQKENILCFNNEKAPKNFGAFFVKFQFYIGKN